MLLAGQNRKIDELKKENKVLREITSTYQKAKESFKKQNNVVIHGLEDSDRIPTQIIANFRQDYIN